MIRLVISIAGEPFHVPYFCLNLLKTSGMGVFLNSPVTFPGGPGGKLRRRRETKSSPVAVQRPGDGTQVVGLAATHFNPPLSESHLSYYMPASILRCS